MDQVTLRDDEIIVIKVADMCVSLRQPMRYVDVTRMIWRAFELGKEYRDLGGKE
jgi:hypothetical protein